MDNARDNATYLYGIADLVSFYHRLENEKVCSEMQDHLRAAIICGLTEFVTGFKLISSGKLTKVKEKIQEPAAEEVPEKEEEIREEQPKRRGRKKKEVAEEAPTTAPTTAHREIDFECGLEKGLAAYSNIDGVTDDSIVNEKLGPIPLANSLPKQGEHPFFKGPAQFVWYLDMERWPMYLANLLDDKNFYPDQLSLYDAKRFEEAKRVGVDIEFVTALVDKETKRMVSIEDFKEADYADDEKGMEALLELKESGFLKKFVSEIDPEKKLLKFLTRFGQNKHIADDLQTIYEEHTEHPNKYIHW